MRNKCFRPFFTRRDELTVSNGLVYWGHRVILPERARSFMLEELHESHPGITAMKSLARALFWYPALDHDIESLVKSCPHCVQCMPLPAAQVPSSWPETDKRWSRLHVDFAGPVEGHMILVLVDAGTKWIEAVPLKTATADTTVEVLRSIFARFGLPHTVVSDNGPQFTSVVTKTFFRDNHVRHVTTAPYYPQSNGAAERAVRTVKEALKKNKVGSLKCRLAKFLLRYRVTPVKDGKSPAEMLLGAQPRTRLSAHFPVREDTKETVKAAAPPSRLILPGTRVWSRQYNRSGQRWLPGTVTAASGGRLLTVDTEEGEQRRHVDQVRLREAQQAQQEASVTHSRESETNIGDEGSLPQQLPAKELGAQTDEGAGTDQPASAVEDPVLPRRSTRKRRVPDRF